ncbi:MAG: protein-L-isoaspartate(D-aspartate) O-methyltransferase [Acidobacteria bacterium]|nr:protein-L-isoaspartate(D-aspartate) O-methyltransferase [Acidobacteriota bacterium]
MDIKLTHNLKLTYQQDTPAHTRHRAEMVARLRKQGIKDERVLAAMLAVPRHLFVPELMRHNSYGDHALPIAGQQTISQPYIVARETELLMLNRHDRVLEIGAGSGYQTAVLAMVAGQVFALERLTELARGAQALMTTLGFHNTTIKWMDGTMGWQDLAPFQGILVAAGSPDVPQPLLDQLDENGRLVIPVGDEREQRLIRATRHGDEFTREDHGACKFVKLIGRHGWQA